VATPKLSHDQRPVGITLTLVVLRVSTQGINTLDGLLQHVQALLVPEQNGCSSSELGDYHKLFEKGNLQDYMGGSTVDDFLHKHNFPRKNGKWFAKGNKDTDHISKFVAEQRPPRRRGNGGGLPVYNRRKNQNQNQRSGGQHMARPIGNNGIDVVLPDGTRLNIVHKQ
jgi:hypothetical protein